MKTERKIGRKQRAACKISVLLMLIFCTSVDFAEASTLFRKQSGTLVLTGTTATVTILPVTMGKSFLIFTGTSDSDVNGDTNGNLMIGGELTNSTTLTFTRTSSTVNATVYWQVLEFVSGVTVQRGSASNVGTATDILLSTVNLAKTFVLTSGYTVTADYGENDSFSADLTTTTNLRLATGAGTFDRVFWQVIQYDDAVVKKVTTTLSTLSTTSTISPAITNLAKAMVISNHRTAAGAVNIQARFLPRTELTNTTTVTYTRNTTSGVSFTFVTYVVEFTDNTIVTRGTGTIAAGATTQDVVISSSLTGSAIINPGNMGRQGASNPINENLGYSWLGFEITRFNNLRLSRGPSLTSTSTNAYQIVTFENEVRTYYSLGSGDWEDNTQWSLSADGSSGPLPVGEFPSRVDNAVIRTGHTITVNNVADNYYPGVKPDDLVQANIGPFAASNLAMFYHTGNILINGTLTISGIEAMLGGYTQILSGGTLTAGSNLVNTGSMEVAAGSSLSTLDDFILTGNSVTTINTNSTSSDDLIIDHTDATLCGTGSTILQNGAGSQITYANGGTINQVCTSFTVTCTGVGCTGFPTVGTGILVPGGNGPAGIGRTDGTTQLVLWLDATRIGAANNATVTTWSDLSGYGYDFTGGTGATYKTNAINGNSALEFNGTSNYFERPYTADLNSSSFTFVAANMLSSGTNVRMVMSSSSNSTFRGYRVYAEAAPALNWRFQTGNGSSFSAISRALNSVGAWITTSASYDATITEKKFFVRQGEVAQSATTAVSQNLVNTRIGAGANETTAANFYVGQMGENIFYNVKLNLAQTNILQNYLAAKYGFPLNAGDLYDRDNTVNGDFDFEVAGIGQASDGTSHKDAQGTGIVRIWNANNLTNGEYLLWGHNNATLVSATNAVGTAVDGTLIKERLVRIWTVSETGDVGTVNVSFDLSALPGSFIGSNLRLLIDRDGDGFQDNDVAPVSGSFVGNTVVFSVNFQTNDRFTIGNTNLSAPLPVTLLDFTAIRKPGSVLLEWQTESEINNDYFEVQRSSDAEHWQTIGERKGAGTTNVKQVYELIDNQPPTGTSYYRLKQNDFDGTADYSKIVSVYFENAELTAWPNPSDGVFHISNLGEAKVEVLNYHGQKALFTYTALPESIIDITAQPAGMYIIKTILGNTIHYVKVLKR